MFGGLFFATLFIAAFTSVISMLEHTFSSTKLNGTKKIAIGAFLFAIGMLSILSYSPLALKAFNMPYVDLLDFVFGTVLAPLSALMIIACCAYILPMEKVAQEIGMPKEYSRAFVFLVKRIIPLALVLLILFSQISGLY